MLLLNIGGATGATWLLWFNKMTGSKCLGILFNVCLGETINEEPGTTVFRILGLHSCKEDTVKLLGPLSGAQYIGYRIL